MHVDDVECGWFGAGWHFCSVCTKPGSFQCYTCPTAYCGSCIQEAEFLMLRKRKGLCEDCLPIVSMIERNETTNADGVRGWIRVFEFGGNLGAMPDRRQQCGCVHRARCGVLERGVEVME